MDKFEQKQNFPNVFGAIGVTHIAIKAPKSIQKLMSVKKFFFSTFNNIARTSERSLDLS